LGFWGLGFWGLGFWGLGFWGLGFWGLGFWGLRMRCRILGRQLLGKDIASELFGEELIPGHIRLESPNGPIAVADRFSYRVVRPITCCICVSSDIKPVSCVSLPVGWGCQ
jgi:hypothetical protein